MDHSGHAFKDTDTIFAPASGGALAAVTVVRLSGPLTQNVVVALAGSLPEPRFAALRKFHRSVDHELIDQGLLLWFPGPASYTGEDCAEFQLHGGRGVLSAILAELESWPGLRPAQPGEFSKRAFLNGKLDLSQVEGLGDLIDSETEQQRRQALRQMGGSLSLVIEGWRAVLIRAAALLEAELDFADEGDVPDHLLDQVRETVAPVMGSMQTALRNYRVGERLRDGFTVVIAGPPNAGKSSLMNAIAQRDVAIVSPIAGTTRDLVEVHLDLGGYPVVLVDTAGVRPSDDPIEREGIARAMKRAERADLVLWLDEHGGPPPDELSGDQVWRVLSKADMDPDKMIQSGLADLAISTRDGFGLLELLGRIQAAAAPAADAGTAILTRHRHQSALSDCIASLKNVIHADEGVGLELIAEDLRLAIRALGRIAGRVDVEDVLSEIFSSFCIGK